MRSWGWADVFLLRELWGFAPLKDPSEVPSLLVPSASMADGCVWGTCCSAACSPCCSLVLPLPFA